jgi:glycine cleavage system H protein
MNIPENLYYTREHEWVRAEGSQVTIGITDHAQEQLGEVVYIDLPVEGDRVSVSGTFGVVESVKAVSDLFAPVNGEVVRVNQELDEHPEWINEDPYGQAWMIVVAMDDVAELENLLDAKGYEAFLAEESE